MYADESFLYCVIDKKDMTLPLPLCGYMVELGSALIQLPV